MLVIVLAGNLHVGQVVFRGEGLRVSEGGGGGISPNTIRFLHDL